MTITSRRKRKMIQTSMPIILVWEWWRAKGPKLNYFFTAARLVAIIPTSSAAVERVFSQVKFIVNAVGESVLEETLETRVMERVNEYKSRP